MFRLHPPSKTVVSFTTPTHFLLSFYLKNEYPSLYPVPFRRLSRFPGLRWRYSIPSPHKGRGDWATLFLGYISTGTWPYRLGDVKDWDNKMWSWVPQDSDPRESVLTRPKSNSKLQIRPLIREGAPHKETCNFQTENKDTKTDWPTSCRS
jgi:hypothetical protein